MGTNIKNIQDLTTAVKNGEVKSVTLKNGTKYRLFTNNDNLCYFKGKRTRRGFLFVFSFDDIKKIEFEKTLEQKNEDYYKIVSKYKRYAEKASFSNNWILDCLKLPNSFEEWNAIEKNNLYDFEITTGVSIEGKCITLNSISNKYPYIGTAVRDAIKNRRNYHSSRVPFNGYEATIEIVVKEDELYGFLSIERKNCGNGDYYMLINDDTFIGHDID